VIRFACPRCDAVYELPVGRCGQTIGCVGCQGPLIVPHPAPVVGVLADDPDADANATRITAGVLACTLGAFGVHRLYLGHYGVASAQLALGLLGLLFPLLLLVAAAVGVVEGVVLLTRSDLEFRRKYLRAPRGRP
jgi:hypothetical protein